MVAPDGWAGRAVTGAHSIEIEHPARWLDRDWVMLTTGVHLPDDPADQRQLIDELDDAGVAALGFGLGIAHHEVPRRADRAGDGARLPAVHGPAADRLPRR